MKQLYVCVSFCVTEVKCFQKFEPIWMDLKFLNPAGEFLPHLWSFSRAVWPVLWLWSLCCFLVEPMKPRKITATWLQIFRCWALETSILLNSALGLWGLLALSAHPGGSHSLRWWQLAGLADRCCWQVSILMESYGLWYLRYLWSYLVFDCILYSCQSLSVREWKRHLN